MLQIAAYRRSSQTAIEVSLDALPPLIGDEDVVLWLDMAGESPEYEALLCNVFGLHPLIVEDMFQESLPKLEDHEDYLYLIVHALDQDGEQPLDVRTIEIDVVIGSNWLITHHGKVLRSVDKVRKALWQTQLTRGPAYLAHAIIDRLTDFYPPLMDRFDVALEDLELEIIRSSHPAHLQRIFDLKGSLQVLRRITIHQKDILHQLASREFARVPEAIQPFFRDVYDHFVQVSDLADSYRERTGASLDAYLGMQSNKLSEVMKVLTLISTIMLPLHFVTGFYGMNFEHMPLIHWKYGHDLALLIMLAIVVSMLVYFRRRRWI